MLEYAENFRVGIGRSLVSRRTGWSPIEGQCNSRAPPSGIVLEFARVAAYAGRRTSFPRRSKAAPDRAEMCEKRAEISELPATPKAVTASVAPRDHQNKAFVRLCCLVSASGLA
jgi:hypothetical protein